jgi:hypothetical protein
MVMVFNDSNTARLGVYTVRLDGHVTGSTTSTPVYYISTIPPLSRPTATDGFGDGRPTVGISLAYHWPVMYPDDNPVDPPPLLQMRTELSN